MERHPPSPLDLDVAPRGVDRVQRPGEVEERRARGGEPRDPEPAARPLGPGRDADEDRGAVEQRGEVERAAARELREPVAGGPEPLEPRQRLEIAIEPLAPEGSAEGRALQRLEGAAGARKDRGEGRGARQARQQGAGADGGERFEGAAQATAARPPAGGQRDGEREEGLRRWPCRGMSKSFRLSASRLQR